MNRRAISDGLLLPGFLWAGCVVLLQAHSIPYWLERTGTWLGVLWSIMLEAAAFVLLYYPGRGRRCLGFVMLVLLVSVPFYQVTRPALETWSHAQAAYHADVAARTNAKRHIARIDDDLVEIKARLNSYVQNSRTRMGWEPIMREVTQEKLAKEQERASYLAVLEEPLVHAYPWWRALFEAGMPALSLVVFQLMAGWMIVRISNFRWSTMDTERASEPGLVAGHAPAQPQASHGAAAGFAALGKSNSGTQAGFRGPISADQPKGVARSQEALKALHGRVQAAIQKHGSQRAICEIAGIGEPDLSLFLALFHRSEPPSRKPSRKAVIKLLDAYPPGRSVDPAGTATAVPASPP